jgi:hypothetical protein
MSQDETAIIRRTVTRALYSKIHCKDALLGLHTAYCSITTLSDLLTSLSYERYISIANQIPVFPVHSYRCYLASTTKITRSTVSRQFMLTTCSTTQSHSLCLKKNSGLKKKRTVLSAELGRTRLRLVSQRPLSWRMLTRNTTLKICSTYLRKTTLLQSVSLDFRVAILCHVFYHSDMADL